MFSHLSLRKERARETEAVWLVEYGESFLAQLIMAQREKVASSSASMLVYVCLCVFAVILLVGRLMAATT